MQKEDKAKPICITHLKDGPLGSESTKIMMKTIKTKQNILQNFNDYQFGSGNILQTEKIENSNTPNIKKQIQKQNKAFQKKAYEHFNQAKQYKWQRQAYLKYICFLQHFKQYYKTKPVWVKKTCQQYLGSEYKQSFTLKHCNLQFYHKSIDAMIHSMKKIHHFTKTQIDNQKEDILKYLQERRAIENSILEEPFEFQKYLHNLNFQPINQTCNISLNQIVISSSSLNYTITNLETSANDSDNQFFKDKKLASTRVFVLLNAQFTFQEKDIEFIKKQIKQQILENTEKIAQKQRWRKKLRKKRIKKGKKQPTQSNQIIQEINQKTEAVMDQLKQKTQLKSIPNKILQDTIYIEPQDQIEKLDLKAHFGKASKQLLDLSNTLGLSRLQINQLALQSEERLFQYRVMRKEIGNSDDFNQVSQQKQKSMAEDEKKKASIKRLQSFFESKILQIWTEHQILRMVVFAVLNAKLFPSVHSFQDNVIRLMLQFLKNRRVESAQNKFRQLTHKCHNIEAVLQRSFQLYKFTRQQYLMELKRQYQRYLNNPAQMILQMDKIFSVYAPSDITETQVRAIIEKKLLEEPLEISCITLSKQSENLTEIILKHFKQFKEECGIKNNLKPSQIYVLFQRICKNNPDFMTLTRFKFILKRIENREDKLDAPKSVRIQNTKKKFYKLIGTLPPGQNVFKVRILVEFIIYDKNLRKSSVIKENLANDLAKSHKNLNFN